MKVKTAILIFIALFILLGIAVLLLLSLNNPIVYPVPNKLEQISPERYLDPNLDQMDSNGKGF